MGVTALEAFALHIPVITFPSAQTTPALVAAMLELMDLRELIASSTEEMVELTVRLTNNAQFCAGIKSKLQGNVNALFSNADKVLAEWRRMLFAAAGVQGVYST